MATTQEQQQQTQPEHSPPISATVTVFTFWAYFTVLVSLITLISIFIYSLTPQSTKTWFISLPNDVRHHYSLGKIIKVQTSVNSLPIEVFVFENGPRGPEGLNGVENVFLVHGFGCSSYSFRNVFRSLGLNGFRVVAIDLPGSGFSDSLRGNEGGGIFGRMWDVYRDIKEKGIFWGFDQLVENGRIAYEGHSEEDREFGGGSVEAEMKNVIGQVIDSMGLSPVHLVLHDSGLLIGANWVLENVGSVSSVTLVDTSPRFTALPLGVLDKWFVRELVLGVSFVYGKVIRICCSRSIEMSVVQSHRALLRGREGIRAMVGVAKGLNYSFDLGEWRGKESVKNLPVQVVWSGNWTDKWSDEGRSIAGLLPSANFVMHSGGRWPQEDASEELTQAITRFVSSLPKSVNQVKHEPLPEHIQKVSVEVKESDHHQSHDYHKDEVPGYVKAYGLDQT